jgi:phospholipase D1/2
MAGASEVRFGDFILGTFLGMLPGLLVMTFFGDRLESVIRDPKAESIMILAALALTLILLMSWLRRRFMKSGAEAAGASTPDEGECARRQ